MVRLKMPFATSKKPLTVSSSMWFITSVTVPYSLPACCKRQACLCILIEQGKDGGDAAWTPDLNNDEIVSMSILPGTAGLACTHIVRPG